MKNISIVKIVDVDEFAWKLINLGGQSEISALRIFSGRMQKIGSATNTIKTYCRCVASYIDFALETKRSVGLGWDADEIVIKYFMCLYSGEYSNDSDVRNLSSELGIKPHSDAGIIVYRSALARFFSEMQKLVVQGIDYLPLVGGVDCVPKAPVLVQKITGRAEQERRMEESVLAGCIRERSNISIEVTSLPELAPKGKVQRPELDHLPGYLDFEINILQVNNLRDKCLYALLLASGCRISEALQTLTDDIDLKEGRVYFRNPRRRRVTYYEMGLSPQDVRSLSFKGRLMARAYLVEPYSRIFWMAYSNLLQSERYMPTIDVRGFYVTHRFVFRSISGESKGRPLCLSCNWSNIERDFKKSMRGVKGDVRVHVLRHCYVTYLSQDLGMDIERVRDLVGHISLSSTEKYDHGKCAPAKGGELRC